MHLDEERLQRLLHGELPPQEEISAGEHVAGCDECRGLLAEARQEEEEVLALLRTQDTPPPSVSVEAIALRGELSSAAAARTRGSAWLRRAAGVALAVGIAGAAYAIPGSPVRKWIDGVVEKIGSRPQAPGSASSPGARAGVSGIAVLPGEKLTILFTRGGQGKGRVFASLVDAPEVQIQAPAGAASFTTKGDYILIEQRDPTATFEVRIPRSAPWVEIMIGEDRVFLKEGSRITTSASSTTGGYILPLSPSQPPDLPPPAPRPGLKSSQPGP